MEWSVIIWIPDDRSINRKEIDISSLIDQNLHKLKMDDPFLYYSIPSIRRKSYLLDDGDDGDDGAANKTPIARRLSLPSRSPQDTLHMDVPEDTSRRESIVRRNSCLSTEAHPSLILEEMMLQELFELDIDETDDDDDMDDASEQLFTDFDP